MIGQLSVELAGRRRVVVEPLNDDTDEHAFVWVHDDTTGRLICMRLTSNALRALSMHFLRCAGELDHTPPMKIGA